MLVAVLAALVEWEIYLPAMHTTARAAAVVGLRTLHVCRQSLPNEVGRGHERGGGCNPQGWQRGNLGKARPAARWGGAAVGRSWCGVAGGRAKTGGRGACKTGGHAVAATKGVHSMWFVCADALD